MTAMIISRNSSSTSQAWLTYEQKHFLIKTHGAILTFAYFFFISLGIASARYLRRLGPNRFIGGHRIWFMIHRTANWISMGLIAGGILAILIAYEFEWKGPKPGGLKNTSPGAMHSLFGALSIFMVASQPISVLFKCPLGDNRRKWFNVIHRTMGMGSWIAAAISMTIAAKNFGKRISDTEAAFNICIILFVSMAVLVAIGEVIKKIINESIMRLGIRGESAAAQNQMRIFQIMAVFCLFSAGVCTYITILIYRT